MSKVKTTFCKVLLPVVFMFLKDVGYEKAVHSLSNGNSGTSKFAWDNFDKCESAYKWAKEKPSERHFKFHALVWGSQYLNFLCKKKNPGITVELTKKYITEW